MRKLLAVVKCIQFFVSMELTYISLPAFNLYTLTELTNFTLNNTLLDKSYLPDIFLFCKTLEILIFCHFEQWYHSTSFRISNMASMWSWTLVLIWGLFLTSMWCTSQCDNHNKYIQYYSPWVSLEQKKNKWITPTVVHWNLLFGHPKLRTLPSTPTSTRRPFEPFSIKF